MFDAPEINPAEEPADKNEAIEPLRMIMHLHQDSRAKDLDAIRQKIRGGHYLTRKAAEESAQRMRNDGEFE